MRLATILHPGGTALAACSGQGFVDLTRTLGAPIEDLDALCALLAGDPAARFRLADAAGQEPRWAPGEVRLLAPIRRPGKIVCVGLNYLDHCRETATPVPASPVLFAKFPSAIIGPGEPIDLHPGTTSEVDWEVELAAVVGERCGPGRPAGVGSLLGFTVANDISARDLQRDDGQWVRAKSLDTFCPLGPVVVTPDEVGDPQDLAIGLSINGEPQQRSHTREMIFSVADLLRRLTQTITLLPGDLVLTGTPHGTGGFQVPPRYLRPGDVVEAWIDQIGSITNVATLTSRSPQGARAAGEPPPATPPEHLIGKDSAS